MKNPFKKLKQLEWSKIFSTTIAFAFGIYGIWCGIEYYKLCHFAIEQGQSMPDSTLAVTSMSTVIASLVSYLLYQAGLKNSRNKYGIREDGEPYQEKSLEEDLE